MSAKLQTLLAHLRRSGNRTWCVALMLPALVLVLAGGVEGAPGTTQAHDPGVRGGPPGAGMEIAGLTPTQMQFFTDGQSDFQIVASVTGTVSNTASGLGPRFNAESCAQCHSQPAIGGSSPFVNPQVADASDQGAHNQIPAFITSNGPVREARFPFTLDLQHVDGGVHALFTITGRVDAGGCNIQQDDFARAAQEDNLVFRIPTPLYGGGYASHSPDNV